MSSSNIIPKVFHLNTRTLFFVLLSLLVLVFLAYVFLVNKTVMNVVERERVEKDIASLSSSMGELEFKYIGLKNSITLDLAYEKGFSDAIPTSFLAREKSVPGLSYNYSR